jgi:hypothetical protein
MERGDIVDMIGGSEALMLLILILFLGLILISWIRVRAGRQVTLRPIKAFDLIGRVAARAVEMGRASIFTLGSGGIGGATTLDTLAGLQIMSQVVGRTTVAKVPLVTQVADPVTMVAAQGLLKRGYAEAGSQADYDPNEVRFIAPDPVAYAVGVMIALRQEPVASHVMAGSFGEEYLLMGETGAARGVEQVAGSSNPQVLPFQYATVDELLMGEELYAGGAYLASLPWHLASLVAQDWLRTLLIAVILAGIILRTLGVQW